MTRLAVAVSTVGPVGYAPVAPGTAGSLAGLALFGLTRLGLTPPGDVAVILGLLALGTWSATVAARHFERPDPGPVVIDEVVGMLITLALLPVSWVGALVGFVVFRALDVIKPFPADRLERLPGGWGIMLDDVVAGAYANLVIRGLAWAFPGWMW